MPDGSVPMILIGPEKTLGGMSIRRVLPYRSRRMVAPFIDMDHMDPVALDAVQGVYCRWRSLL